VKMVCGIEIDLRFIKLEDFMLSTTNIEETNIKLL